MEGRRMVRVRVEKFGARLGRSTTRRRAGHGTYTVGDLQQQHQHQNHYRCTVDSVPKRSRSNRSEAAQRPPATDHLTDQRGSQTTADLLAGV
ncbi:hypothetical protein CSOJ01_08995 [Colletotrichum sojae]|uniref:Uncharacterized protein n=1 Tax=Colletotrichum sojae TaxID=2175907 RepID=A0A8H6MS34_9PEZI|nr:hypothetical protein CSOJ01_08995 [Colletotrichum sojae]